jgi:SAM-dependent methyltransferase
LLFAGTRSAIMPTIRLTLPLYLPSWLHSSLCRVKRSVFGIPASPHKINILGERQVEWTFISSEMPQGPGEALEFGCEYGYLSLLAARKGFCVTALDLQPQNFSWDDPNVRFVQADLLKAEMHPDSYDLIINCSSVEHVGLPGRYGVNESATDGDLEVMQRLRRLLKPGGKLLATLPCGRDMVVSPWHRVYGNDRLPRLLNGFEIERELFWVKDAENRWVKTDRHMALDFTPCVHPTDPHQCSYALGGFVLRKNGPAVSRSGGAG